MATSTPAGGTMRPKRMLKPWAKNSASPSRRLGAISASYTDFCSVSGSRIMITSAQAVASAIDITVRPSASALAFDDDPSRRPTTTSTPDSFRFSAWAWPCEPYPITATLRSAMKERSASAS